MTGRPRLLFLSQTLPYPTDGGVKIRTYHVLRQLANVFDVTALCFYRWKPGAHEPNVAEALGALREFARVEAFPIPQEHSPARLLWDHLRSLVRQEVYTVYAYDSHDFRSRLRAILSSERFDLVHADSLDLSGYFALCRDIPLICVHHDAQSALLLRRAQHEVRLLRRAYIALQARLMAQEERRWCRRVTLNVTVSEPDRDWLERQAPGGSFAVVPNGVDLEAFQPSYYGDGEGMVFVGGSSWFPNADAMHYFCADILPLVRRTRPAAPMTWVGRTTPQEQQVFAGRGGMRVTGYVADVRPFVQSAACYVVPIRVGGGTRIKILDAWAMGKAVVSTSIGCEGLKTVDGENILIRDEPQAFAEAVNLLLGDRELGARLGKAARATVEAHYGWDRIGQQMAATYLEACGREAG